MKVLPAHVAALLLLKALLACTPEVRTSTEPGLSAEDRARQPVIPPPAEPPAQPAAAKPAFAELPSSLKPAKPNPTAAAAPGTEPVQPNAAGEASKEKKRDLSAELQALLGQPTDCLDLQKVVDDGGKIKIKVGAYVGPSGRITRASVSAPGQPAQAATCIERRAVALKMQDPIEDAPRMVEAELSFEIARAQAPAAPKAPTPTPAPTPGY